MSFHVIIIFNTFMFNNFDYWNNSINKGKYYTYIFKNNSKQQFMEIIHITETDNSLTAFISIFHPGTIKYNNYLKVLQLFYIKIKYEKNVNPMTNKWR